MMIIDGRRKTLGKCFWIEEIEHTVVTWTQSEDGSVLGSDNYSENGIAFGRITSMWPIFIFGQCQQRR